MDLVDVSWGCCNKASMNLASLKKNLFYVCEYTVAVFRHMQSKQLADRAISSPHGCFSKTQIYYCANSLPIIITDPVKLLKEGQHALHGPGSCASRHSCQEPSMLTESKLTRAWAASSSTVLPFPLPPLLSIPYFHIVPSSLLSKVAILEFCSPLQLTTLLASKSNSIFHREENDGVPSSSCMEDMRQWLTCL
jgi:hypothetical protein